MTLIQVIQLFFWVATLIGWLWGVVWFIAWFERKLDRFLDRWLYPKGEFLAGGLKPRRPRYPSYLNETKKED